MFIPHTFPQCSIRNLQYLFQNRTTKISTGPAGNFHFSLALEWVTNVEWA